MKILAIGNSFSQDATTYIERIAESAGIQDLIAANLYIGGCPLSRHAENLVTDEDAYEYQRHGVMVSYSSIKKALASEKWDVVTIQQASGYSGKFESYEPYADELCQTIKELCPDAKILIHRTWAYEKGSTHYHFAFYDRDRATMDAAIEEAYGKLASRLSLDRIPVGNLVTKLGKLPQFDPEKGGISLYRDGFHLSYTYGRFAAGCIWLKKLISLDLSKVTFRPDDTDEELIDVLIHGINEYFA